MAAADLVYRTPPATRFVSAAGLWLQDLTGRRYLDAEAANGTLAWGYDATLLSEAARRAAQLPALPSFCESELRVRVLHRLANRFDSAVGVAGRVALELGGAQGIEMAMRIVAAHRGSGPILTFQGGYHGRSPLTGHLSASARYRAGQPWPGPEVIRLPYPDCASCPHRLDGCNPACAETVRRLGREDQFGLATGDARHAVAALIVEPLLNVAGGVLPDSEHLRQVVSHVRQLGGLIVVDEVFTGLHRLGPAWGFLLHEIRPDIVVASKALTNGATAFSCVWAREPLADPAVLTPGSHSSTFAGNPHSLAVVDTVLDRWDGWTEIERDVHVLGAALDAGLSDLAGRHRVIGSTNVVGGLARVVLTGPYAARVRELAVGDPQRPGLLLASTGMAPNTLMLHPPLVTTADEVATMVRLLDQALSDLAPEL